MTTFLGAILAAVLIVLMSAPVAWLAMLFLGNVGVNTSFLGTLPGAAAAMGLAIIYRATTYKA